jgi:hypothetical protein
MTRGAVLICPSRRPLPSAPVEEEHKTAPFPKQHLVPAAHSRHNRKRPAGEEGRFWGYYREERTPRL